MKFIDEATIEVIAGDGGQGCARVCAARSSSRSAARTAATAASGGSVFAVADRNLNTLIDYRYARSHQARNGETGRGSDQFGAPRTTSRCACRSAPSCSDLETGEIIADLIEPDVPVLLAKGGEGGFGNLHFKTSHQPARRARRRRASPASSRKLKLELQVLADVGPARHAQRRQVDAHLGRCRTRGRRSPTTRSRRSHPNLGVVRVGPSKSFVIADIPGLIEGAAEGAGLGPPVPAPPAAHAPAAARRRPGAVRRGRRPGGRGQGHRQGTEEVRRGAVREAALAGAEQAGHGAGGRARTRA